MRKQTKCALCSRPLNEGRSEKDNNGISGISGNLVHSSCLKIGNRVKSIIIARLGERSDLIEEQIVERIERFFEAAIRRSMRLAAEETGREFQKAVQEISK